MIRNTAKCICGEVTTIPPKDEWKEERKDACDKPDCTLLNKCSDCHWKHFLTRYCSCGCDRCLMVNMRQHEVREGNEPDFGVVGTTRIPKGERWNPALGEYCETTGDVEKYRKEQGKEYVKGEPPKPYQTSKSEEAKEKRRKFADEAVSLEVPNE